MIGKAIGGLLEPDAGGMGSLSVFAGASSAMHDLAQVLGRLFAAHADESKIRIDAGPRSDP